MGIVRVWSGTSKKPRNRSYKFTVVVLPVYDSEEQLPVPKPKRTGKLLQRSNPVGDPVGYQSTVPVLPGLITFGRTPDEAREMAEDAIRVHLEGLRKSGLPIPDESEAQIEPVRIRVSA